MAAGTTVSILPCGAMTADLTWLLLAPNRSIRNRNNKDLPAEWVDVPTHCVLVDTPDGRLLWDTSCPRDWETHWAATGLQDFFPYDKVSDEELWAVTAEEIVGEVFGDVDDELHLPLREQIAARTALVPLGEIFLGGDILAGLMMFQPFAADMGGKAQQEIIMIVMV